MPDHCHMIIESQKENINILDVLDDFKQHSGFWFYKIKSPVIWQTGYCDHILRDENDVKNQFYYILNNPVRKSLIN